MASAPLTAGLRRGGQGVAKWQPYAGLVYFHLLLDTASDIALPWHWRSLCLDQAWRPLRDLEKLSQCACRLKRWQSFAWRLATCELLPSISVSDLVQGSSDE